MAERSPDPRTPPPPPASKDTPGWRVAPAPDGRGGKQERQPMIPWSPRRFIVILIGLFVLNWALVQVFAPAEKEIRVPYTPTFLNQLRDSNVKEISSTGETLQVEFKKDVSYGGE